MQELHWAKRTCKFRAFERVIVCCSIASWIATMSSKANRLIGQKNVCICVLIGVPMDPQNRFCQLSNHPFWGVEKCWPHIYRIKSSLYCHLVVQSWQLCSSMHHPTPWNPDSMTEICLSLVLFPLSKRSACAFSRCDVIYIPECVCANKVLGEC